MLASLKTGESKDNHLTKTLPQVFGVSAAAIGFVALLGWILGLPLLASFGAGLIPMAPSTALLFVMFGVAVFFCNRMPQNRATYLMGVVIGATGAVTALLLFFSSSAGIYLQIEYLGLSISGAVDGSPIGHMSPVTAICFVVIALSFLATLSSSAGRPKRALAAFLLACLVVWTSSLFLLAYFYGAPLMYGGEFVPPALPTSLAFLVLALGLLATPGLQVWLDSGIKDAATARLSYFLGLIFVIVAAGIVTAGYLYYRNHEKQHRAQVEGQLSAVSELKVGELVQWRKERLGDASLLFKNASFSALVRRFFKKPEDADAQLQLRSWLGKYQAHIEYDRVFLLDSRGVTRMAAPAAPEPVASTIILQRASEILRSSQIAFQDFYRDEHNQRVYLAVLVPILDETDASRPLGVLVLQIDPTTYLYPFIQRWPTPSRTSETLIIRRDGNDALVLNELKFKTNFALNLRIPLESKDVPAVKAALGQEGIAEGMDYRGVPVIASVRAIPGSPWSIVARMDVDENYGPLREKLWVLVFLIGALLIGAGVSITLIWRQQHIRFYRERYQAAEALQVQYNELQTLREVGNIILTSSDLKSALARVLAEILPSCSLDLGVVRLLDAKSQNLEPIASLGFSDPENENILRTTFLATGRDSIIAHVLAEKKTAVLENLRELGLLPIMQREGIQSAILVPIKTEQQILGILQVGNRTTRRFQPDEVRLLEGASNLIGIGVQKAQLYEETHRNLERIRALHEIDKAIASTLDLRTVLDILMEKTELLLPCPAAITVRLLDKETDRLERVACRNIDEEGWKGRIGVNPRFASQVIATKAPLIVPDVRNNPDTQDPDFVRRHGLISYIGLPLIVKDKSVGVLGIYTKAEHEFTHDEVQLLTTLAGQAAIAINNAQLYENIDLSRKELELTNQYLDKSLRLLSGLYTALTPLAPSESIPEMMDGIIARIKEATGADAVLIRLWDDAKDAFAYISHRGYPDSYVKGLDRAAPDGAANWVFTSGEPIISPNTAEDTRFRSKRQLEAGFHSCAILPLKTENRVRGLVYLASNQLGYFDEEQSDHLMAIARQMGIALENRELFDNLKASRDELEKANKVKDEFLSIMSHEMRTPLNVVVGYSGMIMDGMLGEVNEKQKEAMEKIIRRANDQLVMINNVLYATVLETEKIKVESHELSLGDFLTQLKSGYEAPINKKLVFNWNYPADLPLIRTDSAKLKQILQNLIENAIKFTDKGSVSISAKIIEGGGSWLELKVADTGAGIPKEALPMIFDKFKQADSSETRRFGGVGMGLYIVKRFAELLGGRVEVESEAGKGSTFTVILPCGQ